MPINPASINVIPNNNVVELVQPGIITVQVTAPGPQGPQGPAGSGGTDTGSLLTTASVSLNTITFTKGNGTTFPITVDTGSGGGGGGGVQSVISSSLGAYVSASGNNVIVSASIFQISASSIQLTGSLTSSDTVVFSNTNNQFTGSLAGTSSWASNAVTASYVLNAISSSFASTASLAPNSVTTASVNLNTITFTKGDTSTFSLTVNTGSGGGSGTGFPFSGSAIITGSLLVSGSGVTITGSLNMLGPIIVPFVTPTNNYQLQLSDAGDIVEMNVGSANTVTIPSSSVTNFLIGTQITVVQYGTGQTTFTTGSTNVLLRSAGNATKLAAQFAGATLIKRGTDEWYLLGNVTV
jgi:hypothetical protein